MLQIGMVGLGPSHPEAFGDVFRDGDEATVSAVWDGGAVRDREYVDWFTEEYDATEFDDLSEMARAVDGAMIEAVNWDTHLDLARPFLSAGVPTFVEKPLVGTHRDLMELTDLSEDTPLFGGSAVPYHPQLDDLPLDYPGRTLHGIGYNHFYYYGSHIVDAIRRIAGGDWTSVSPIGGPGECTAIQFSNRTNATVRLEGPTDDASFAILDVSDRTYAVPLPHQPRTYERFMDAWLEVIRGERDETGRVLDSAGLHLAMCAALEHGAEVTRDGPLLEEVHVDGDQFLETY